MRLILQFPKTVILVLLFLMGFTIYGSTLKTGFVAWDDNIHVFENPLLTPPSFAKLDEIWKGPYKGLYTPMTYTVWLFLTGFDRSPHASSPESRFDPSHLHAFSVLIHILNAFLVFNLIQLLLTNSIFLSSRSPATQRIASSHSSKLNFQQWGASAFGSLLFLVHPLQTEAVAWISGFRDLLAGFFSLAAIHQYLVCICFRIPSAPRKKIAYVWASAAFGSAILSKPSAVCVIPILGILLFVKSRATNRRELFISLSLLLPWLGAAVLLAGLTYQTQSPFIYWIPPLYYRPFIAWDAFSFYLQKFLLIGSFAPDYGRTPSALLTTPQLGWTALGGAVISGVIWKYRRREPGIAAAFLVFSMALLPNSGWIPFTFQNLSTVADRYAYLALLGGSLGIAYFLRSLSRPKMLAAGSALIILFGIITSRQVKIWENSETLLNYSLQQNPHSWFALNNMGLYLQRQGQPEKALAYHRQALELNPKALEIEYNYGTALLALHREPELIDHYIKLINKNPRLFGIHLNLALAYDQMGLVEEAISHALQAVQINPNFWEGHYNLAGYFLRQNNREGALTEYQTVLRLNPSSEMARLKVKELEGIKPQ